VERNPWIDDSGRQLLLINLPVSLAVDSEIPEDSEILKSEAVPKNFRQYRLVHLSLRELMLETC
jgi:hypothetical protein